MKKVRARYRPIGGNPFDVPCPKTAKIEGEAPDHMPMVELKKFAKEATPPGYEFIEVEIIK